MRWRGGSAGARAQALWIRRRARSTDASPVMVRVQPKEPWRRERGVRRQVDRVVEAAEDADGRVERGAAEITYGDDMLHAELDGETYVLRLSIWGLLRLPRVVQSRRGVISEWAKILRRCAEKNHHHRPPSWVLARRWRRGHADMAQRDAGQRPASRHERTAGTGSMAEGKPPVLGTAGANSQMQHGEVVEADDGEGQEPAREHAGAEAAKRDGAGSGHGQHPQAGGGQIQRLACQIRRERGWKRPAGGAGHGHQRRSFGWI